MSTFPPVDWSIVAQTSPEQVWALPPEPNLNEPVQLPYSTNELKPEQLELLTAWESTKTKLAKLKEYEITLRKEIVYRGGFFSTAKTSGTERVDLEDGYELKSVKVERYTLKGKDKVEAALEHFTDFEADMLVKWNPTLSVTAYKALSPEQKAHFNECLEIKEGAPTLEIVAPK